MIKLGAAHKLKRTAVPRADAGVTRPQTKTRNKEADRFGGGARPQSSIDAGAIEKDLTARTRQSTVRAGTTRLPDGAWNGHGAEPTPLYFTDLGKPSDFWKAALKTPALAAYAHLSSERTMLSVMGVQREKNGLGADIQIHTDSGSHIEHVELPMSAGLGQLVADPATKRAPILPLPLQVYTREGSALSMADLSVQGQEKLEPFAKLLGIPPSSTAWDPRTETYDKIGEQSLASVAIKEVGVSIYGDVTVSFQPAYDLSNVFMDPTKYREMSTDSPEKAGTVTVSRQAFLENPGVPADLKAAVAEALGERP